MPADLKKPFNVNREMLAWAAGILEGEGTIAGRHGKWGIKDRAIAVRVKMTDEDVIRRFHYVVQVGNVTGPNKPQNPKHKWTWQAGNFEAAQAVVAMLWPWLHARRKAKIKELFSEYHTKKPCGIWGRDPKTGRFAILEVSNG